MREMRYLLILALLCAALPGAALTMTGKVVDLSGEPVAGARVRAILAFRLEDYASVKLTTTTAPDGTFSLKDLPASFEPLREWRYYLVADTSDARFGWIHDSRRFPEDHLYVITVRKLGKLEGRVVDFSGKGVAGAKVSPTEYRTKDYCLALEIPALGVAVDHLKTVTTDSEGRYRLEGVPEGMLATVRAEKEWLAFKGPEKPGGTTVVMIPGGNIAGRVVDGKGKPVAGAVVLARASYSQPGDRPGVLYMRGFVAGSGKATTQADGSYIIRGLNTLRFDLGFDSMPGKFVPLIRRVDVRAGETTIAPDLVEAAR